MELGQFSHFSRRFKGLEQDLENSRRLKEIQGAYEPCTKNDYYLLLLLVCEMETPVSSMKVTVHCRSPRLP